MNVSCINSYKSAEGIFQPAETETTSVETNAQSVWAQKTVHLKGLKSIARTLGISYNEAEDLLVEAAMEYGQQMFKRGVRLGRTMPKLAPLKLKATAPESVAA